jgi:hypothetical protein
MAKMPENVMDLLENDWARAWSNRQTANASHSHSMSKNCKMTWRESYSHGIGVTMPKRCGSKSMTLTKRDEMLVWS